MLPAQSTLRSSVALAMLLVANPAWAQDTQLPSEASQAPATEASAEAPSSADIVVTDSRIRRDPLSQDAPIVF